MCAPEFQGAVIAQGILVPLGLRTMMVQGIIGRDSYRQGIGDTLEWVNFRSFEEGSTASGSRNFPSLPQQM